MKFCDQCGTQLNDNVKYCSACGNLCEIMEPEQENYRCKNCNTQLTRDDLFCPECGKPLYYRDGYKREVFNKKTLLIIVLALVSLFTMISGFLLIKGGINRTGFNIEYSPQGVERFLKVVCRNIDGEYARVTDPNYDGPAGSSCYTAKVEVKLKNSVAQSVQMRFYNQNDSDVVKYGRVIFYDSDSENEFDCRKEFVVALEKTLSGKSFAEDYITSYDEIRRIALSLEHFEPKVIAEYWLTDELKVEISCKRSSWDWYLYYVITKY